MSVNPDLAPKIRGIEVTCLKCGSHFLSWDRRKNRLCKRCNEENDWLLRLYTSESLGIEENHRFK
jgi:formylmethanofuran dehydrogenase subunit E